MDRAWRMKNNLTIINWKYKVLRTSMSPVIIFSEQYKMKIKIGMIKKNKWFSSTFSQHYISFILDFYFFKFFFLFGWKQRCKKLLLYISFDFALDLKRFRNFFSYTPNVKVQFSLVIWSRYVLQMLGRKLRNRI